MNQFLLTAATMMGMFGAGLLAYYVFPGGILGRFGMTLVTISVLIFLRLIAQACMR